MSTYTECVQCLQGPLTWNTLLSLIIQKDTDGSRHLNIYYDECLGCDEYSPAASCASPQTVLEMFAQLIVEDECGNCALHIKSNICESCE